MKGLRWFLAEFFVVVCGVIVAFAINSWWMGVKDEQRERVYLLQIHEDLLATEDVLTQVVISQKNRSHAAAQVIMASYSIILPSDSILTAYTGLVLNFDPGLIYSSTLSSFVNSGNLELVRSDSLRSSLVKTADQLEGYREFTRSSGMHWLVPNFEKVATQLRIADFAQLLVPDSLREIASADSLSIIHPLQNYKGTTRAKWDKLMRDKDFLDALFLLYIAHVNLYDAHKSALENVRELNRKLEDHLNL